MAPKSPAPTSIELDLLRAIETLEAIVADPTLSAGLSKEEHVRLMAAAGRLSRPAKLERLRISRKIRKERHRRDLKADRAAVASTGIREARRADVFVAPTPLLAAPGSPVEEVRKARSCYVCKNDYTRLHHFYDGMCPACADLNYAKRFQSADLSGRTAVITGARLKIGYQAGLKLLRAGARVIVSTRFPHDAARRYAAEPDFGAWGSRLRIHGLDLRHSPSVEVFARYLCRSESRVDALVNNAAQTVRRPVAFYRHLLDFEAKTWKELSGGERSLLEGHYECLSALERSAPDAPGATRELSLLDGASVGVGIRDSARLSQLRMTYDDRTCGREVFPSGRLDADLQQVDLRTQNSWRMTLAEVPTAELLEVLLINSVAPFVLAARLKPLMLQARTREVHVVNVSAMEGIFSRGTKTDKHPHTNMAKAALNMMTRTSAPDYAKDGIHMNAVDTGWVTDEDPVAHAARKQEVHDFQPPLDVVDGAARILDPLFSGIKTGVHASGVFFKDYQPSSGEMAFDWDRVFGRAAPRVIDVGCGSGRFIIESAAARPERDFIGIEAVAPLVERATREALRRGLPNARFIAGDAAAWLEAEAAPASIDEIHIYHPQPYYDPGQVPLELLTPQFFERAWRVLRAAGILVLQTDNRRYGKHLLGALEKHFDPEVLKGAWPDAPLGRTQREILARRKGLPILRVVARRRDVPLDLAPPPPYFDPGRPGLRKRRSRKER